VKKSTRTVFRNGLITTSSVSRLGDIAVEDGYITALGPNLTGIFDEEIDLKGVRILPGGIDPHVHVALKTGNRLTRDDFVSGSSAALSGGITTVFDFSNLQENLALDEAVRSRFHEASRSLCNVFLHATVCGWNSRLEQEAESCIALGVTSFKFFTAYKETGRCTGYSDIERASMWAARHDARIIVHAEDQATLVSPDTFPSDSFIYYEASRPVQAEVTAIQNLAAIQKRTGAAMAIVHVSSGSGVSAACGSGLKLETCPHYLVMTRDLYQTPGGYRMAVAPPLRSRDEQTRLWKKITDGHIDWIGSDHAPYPEEDRRAAGDHFTEAPFGLEGVHSLLSVMIDQGVVKGRITWEQLVALTSENAARFYGIFPQKGCLAEGSDADFVAVDGNGKIRVVSMAPNR
jgi:dihydropyrimidinase